MTLITQKEALSILNISKSSLLEIVKSGTLKRYQIPNTRIYRYKKEDILSLFQ